MRQRKIKGLDLNLMNELNVLVSPKIIETNKDIFLEIGSGKGHFITNLAKDNPNKLYVAMEKNINVCYRIAQKREEMNLNNLIIILDDSNNLLEYLNLKSVSLLYLNFSDPWPKARHHKRRLTYPTFLENYKKVLKNSGVIQFRTDHQILFEDSVLYLEKDFELIEINRNYQSDKYYTEYEIKRLEKGNLYQLKGVLKDEII